MKNRTVILGIDGATFDIINPLIERGELKNLKSLIDTGTKGFLRSTIPSYTPVAISSFLTGMNPGKHGIFDFTITNHNNYETFKNLANSSTIKAPTIWELFGKTDKKIISFLFPLSYPPQPVNGIMVSKVKPEIMKTKPFTYPESLKNELFAHLGNVDYSRMPFSADVRRKYRSSSKDFFSRSLSNLYYKFEKEKEAIRYLMSKHEWDLLMLYFNNTDLTQHWFWKFMDTSHPLYDSGRSEYSEEIFNIYKAIDAFIGELLSKIGNDVNLLIFSDHGFGPLYYKFQLNNWLMDKGLLVIKPGKRKRLTVARRNLKELSRRFGLGELVKVLPGRIKGISFPVPRMTNIPLREIIDWQRTRAYGTLFGININLKGRDPMGIVEKSECDELVNYIKNELKTLSYTDRNCIIENVFQKEELYNGESLDYATDILFIFKNEFPCQVSIDISEDGVFKNTGDEEMLSGTHFSSINGIFVASGKDIERGKVIHGASIIDILPTVLYLMGQPIPSNIDGKVLKDAITSDFLSQNPMEFSEGEHVTRKEFVFTNEEREAIQKELKGLGYLE